MSQRTLTGATTYTGKVHTMTKTTAPAAADVEAAISMITASKSLKKSPYAAEEDSSISSTTMGAKHSYAVSGKLAADATGNIDSTKKINMEKFTWIKAAETTDALATTAMGVVKTGYKTTLVGLFSKLATSTSVGKIMDLSGAMSLAGAAAGVVALSLAL